MKTFLKWAMCILCTSPAFSQIQQYGEGNSFSYLKKAKSYPEGRFQVAMSISDLVMTVPNVSLQYRFYERHAALLRFNNYIYPGDEGLDMEYISANSISLNHKIYIAEANDGCLAFIQHGPRMAWGVYNIDSVVFQPSIENGLTVYRPSNEVFTKSANNYGYDLILGFEFYKEIYFVELNLGISYRRADGSLKSKAYSESSYYFEQQLDWIRPITYTGFKPIFNFKMGLYVDEILQF